MKQEQNQGRKMAAQGPDTRGMERFILIVYSLFDINMFIVAIRWDWPIWTPVVLVLLLFAAWSVYLTNMRDFRFRSMFVSYTMQISLFFYAINKNDLSAVTICIICFSIFTGMYGIKETCHVNFMGTGFIFLYFIATRLQFGFASEESFSRILTDSFCIVLSEIVIYVWVRNRVRNMQNLAGMIASLRAAEQSKNDFLANISHEIRTPVNTIYGMSELIMQAQDLPEVKNQVYDIQTAGRNLMSVVTDIMDFTDLQFGRLEIENEEYNITSTLNDVVNMSVAMKKDKHIEFIVNCDPNMPRLLMGDEKKIRRVIMNLVSNAVKFTNEGCVIIEIGMRKESYGINLIIKVQDTGIGIKGEDLERIFTSFNQVDTKRNRQEGGIGLGMAISKTIVEKMNGVLSVKSKFGQGTSITAVIPQEVIDEEPIIHIENADQINVIVYINMEQFEISGIRDEYFSNVQKIISQLPVEGHSCRNLSELKRRVESGGVTHVFIGRVDYQEDPGYFNELAEKTKVVMVIDHFDERFIETDAIIRLYKPFYILPVVSVLNNETTAQKSEHIVKKGRFVAPDVHVLVVDDNVMNIKVVQGLLANYKIHVTAATSGKEALEKIESKDYDFVFMDHMMPEMDGVETLHQIRGKVGAYFHKVPIIALTANAIAGVRGMFLSEGFADFVEKPVESSVLERVLRRNLPEEKLLPVEEDAGNNGDGGNTENEAQTDKKAAETPSKSVREEEIPEDLKIGDLDIQKGLIYCGGMSQYLDILSLYNKTGPENLENVESLFEKEDWNNYTIAVHAVKSSMLSIGATRLSELAKALEMAGKSTNITYIKENHRQMIEEYHRILGLLMDFHKEQNPESEEENTEELSEIYDVEFDRMVSEMEDAMYGLDEEKMLQIIDELQKCKYCNVPLKKELLPIRHKIEMADYMSAVESLNRVKNKIKTKEGGEADA